MQTITFAGSYNVGVQVGGDGNVVNVGLPYLVLARRHRIRREPGEPPDLLDFESRAVPPIGRMVRRLPNPPEPVPLPSIAGVEERRAMLTGPCAAAARAGRAGAWGTQRSCTAATHADPEAPALLPPPGADHRRRTARAHGADHAPARPRLLRWFRAPGAGRSTRRSSTPC